MINPEDDRYIEIDERIDAFLKGLMTAEEEQALKAEISSDEALKRRIRERLLLLKGIQNYGREKDRNIISQTLSSKPKARIFNLRTVMSAISVAACLVIVVLIGQRYLGGNNDGSGNGGNEGVIIQTNPAMDYAMAESANILTDMHKSLRGTDTETIEKELMPVFDAILKEKDLKANISKLEKLYATSSDDYVDDLDDYGKEIGWFLAIAYMKDGNNAKAITTLQALKKRYPEFNKAGQLLEKLK